MPIIIAIQPHLIRINHRIIILHGNFLHRPIVPRRLPRRHVLQDHLIYQPILQRRRARNAGPKLQHVPVLPHKCIRISPHIRPRANETHLADERLPQAGRCHSIVFWRSITESFDSSMTTTTTAISRESTAKYQASSTYGWRLDIN